MSAKKNPEDERFQRQITRLALLNGLMNGRSISIEAAKKTTPSRAKPTEILPSEKKPKGPTARPRSGKGAPSKKEERAFEKAVEKGTSKLKGSPQPKQKEPKPGTPAYEKLRQKAVKGLTPERKGGNVPAGTTPESVFRKDKYKGGLGEEDLAALWTQRPDPKTGKEVTDYTSTYTANERGRIIPADVEGHPNLWFVEVLNPQDERWLRIINKPISKSRARALATAASAVLWSQNPETGQIIKLEDKAGQEELKEHWDAVSQVIKKIQSEKTPEKVTWENWDALSPEVQEYIQRQFMIAKREDDPERRIFGGQITPEKAKMLMESKDVSGGTVRTRLNNAIKIGLKMYAQKPEKAKLTEQETAAEASKITHIVTVLGKKNAKGTPVALDLRTGKPWTAEAIRELFDDSGGDVDETIAEAKRQYHDIFELTSEINKEGVFKDEQGIPLRLKPSDVAALYYEAGANKEATIALAKEKHLTSGKIIEQEEKEREERIEEGKNKRRGKGKLKGITEEERIEQMKLQEQARQRKEREALQAREEILSRPTLEIAPGTGAPIGTQTWTDFINNQKVYNILALRNHEAIADVNTGEWSDENDKQMFMGLSVPGIKAWIQGQIAMYGGPDVLQGPMTSDAVMHLIQEARQVEGNPYIAHLANYLEQISTSGDPFSSAPQIPPHERQPEPPLD